MLVRKCAGGVIFAGNKVFLLQNEKGEWVLPKSVIPKGDLPNEVVLKRVKEEAGIPAEIVSPAGRTDYEFTSLTRQRPVCEKITWYIMKSLDENYSKENNLRIRSGSFFDIQEAINLISCSHDKSLLNLSYQEFKEMA